MGNSPLHKSTVRFVSESEVELSRSVMGLEEHL